MKYLYNDLTRMGKDEKILEMRSMVFGIISAEVGSVRDEEIRVIVVDEKGEMGATVGGEIRARMDGVIRRPWSECRNKEQGGIRRHKDADGVTRRSQMEWRDKEWEA
ncbi:hypothetical protein SUGI_0711320 [Cryptomeria japonica]|nr:hypothetical protein SUGI_0711320 [Cryptomeria japonica]